MINESEDIARARLGVAAHQLQRDDDVLLGILVDAVGVEADGPVEAADSEGARPDEPADADALDLEAVPVDLKRVGARVL